MPVVEYNEQYNAWKITIIIGGTPRGIGCFPTAAEAYHAGYAVAEALELERAFRRDRPPANKPKEKQS